MASTDNRHSASSLLAETEQFLGIRKPSPSQETSPEDRAANTSDVHRYTSPDAASASASATDDIPQQQPSTHRAEGQMRTKETSHGEMHITPDAPSVPVKVVHPNKRPAIISRDSGHLTPPPSPQLQRDVVPQISNDATELYRGAAGAHPTADVLPDVPHEEKGIAQMHHDDIEVRDVGWNESASHDVTPEIIGGVRNAEYWTLVRRFNKITYHVRAVDNLPPGGMDMKASSDEEFSPDKLRAQLERVYIAFVVNVVAAAKHVARIRSWSERRRTGVFCGVYFTAWSLNVVGPLLLFTLLALVISPRVRRAMLPPAPLALISAKTGELTQPRAGMLGSGDSLTGAPEQHEGEAVEQEAEQVVAGFSNIAINAAIGKHHPDEESPAEVEIKPHTGEEKVVGVDSTAKQRAEAAAPDVATMANKAVDAKGAGAGEDAPGKAKVKKDVNSAMWEKARPVMVGIESAADVWEMLGNALNPTPPFSRYTPFKLGGVVLLPAALASIFITPNMITRGLWLIIGVAFFTDPLTGRTLRWLNTHYPGWTEMLDLRNTLLKGVPTNAQLTVTLLRIGESTRTPLPPPPTEMDESHEKPHANKTMDVDASELPVDGVSRADVQNAVQPSASTLSEDATTDNYDAHGKTREAEEKGKTHKFVNGIIGIFKGTTKTTMEAALATNKARAGLGSVPAKQKLGVVPKRGVHKQEALMGTVNGPVEFPCRYRGVSGKAYIITTASSPCLSFAPDRKAAKKHDGKAEHDGITSHPESKDAEWSIPIAKIKEVRKIGGLGWKGKMIVGWSMDRQVVDGIEVAYVPEHGLKPTGHGLLGFGKSGGEEEKVERKILTAVVERDGLFNRLISMGRQKWECL